MPKFSGNLTFLFSDLPFLDRFPAAKESGFRFIEYAFPYEFPSGTLKELLQKNLLKQVLFNFPPGDWAAGDRGVAADPNRVDEFRQGVDRALEYARALDVACINCLVGNRIESIPYEDQWRVLVRNLEYAAGRLAEEGRVLLVEPLNTLDMKGFFLSTSREGFRLLEEVGASNIRLQYDVYHMQRMEGHLTETIRTHLGQIGHIQIADNPGRHQPGTGEINYRFLLAELDRMGYEGFVGFEYVPQPDTRASLGWVKEWGLTL
jgi:hydroxypyruvate isomerase